MISSQMFCSLQLLLLVCISRPLGVRSLKSTLKFRRVFVDSIQSTTEYLCYDISTVMAVLNRSLALQRNCHTGSGGLMNNLDTTS